MDGLTFLPAAIALATSGLAIFVVCQATGLWGALIAAIAAVAGLAALAVCMALDAAVPAAASAGVVIGCVCYVFTAFERGPGKELFLKMGTGEVNVPGMSPEKKQGDDANEKE